MSTSQAPLSAKALIVGGDGVIGSALYECLLRNYRTVYATSRRLEKKHNFLHVDFTGGFKELNKIARLCDIAFICVGKTNIAECENNRAASYESNVTCTLRIVEILRNFGVFVVWLSSNAVFSGKRPFCGLNEPYMPLTEYGRQKAEAEQKILELDGVAIVRLTKVLSKKTPLISGWVDNLSNGKEIHPFSDVYFSPVSLKYATQAIAMVGNTLKAGIFNVSGSKDISYSTFAEMLAVKLVGGDHLVKPVSSSTSEVKPLLSGRYSSLDMKKLIEMEGIHPQHCSDVLEDLMRKTLDISPDYEENRLL